MTGSEISETLLPGLYLVATPIGNLRDITLRALDLLKAADVIYCEDTRQTAKLLHAYGIQTRTATYHDHSEDKVRRKILDQIQEKKQIVALVSDAGMPLISDPGYKLVQAARAENILVTSLPGANAPLTAVQLSGLPCDKFAFLGFLPSRSAARRASLKEWMDVPATLVFYEAKQRVIPALQDVQAVLGDRPVAVVRELTKKFEEILSGPLPEVLDRLNKREEIRGEFVILIGAGDGGLWTEDRIQHRIQHLLERDVPVKTLSAQISEESGWSKKDIYQRALLQKDT